jgi:hypothetical protein
VSMSRLKSGSGRDNASECVSECVSECAYQPVPQRGSEVAGQHGSLPAKIRYMVRE